MSLTATEESRQYSGTLTLQLDPDASSPPTPVDFAKQVYQCELEPSVDAKGDELEMLNGNVLGADEQVKWVLKIGAVQDFQDPDGFLEFCRTNALKTVAFVWEPNNELDAPTIDGRLKLRPGKYGGATRLRLTSEIEFPVLGEPDVTHPA